MQPRKSDIGLRTAVFPLDTNKWEEKEGRVGSAVVRVSTVLNATTIAIKQGNCAQLIVR